jgi:hypothetical protein
LVEAEDGLGRVVDPQAPLLLARGLLEHIRDTHFSSTHQGYIDVAAWRTTGWQRGDELSMAAHALLVRALDAYMGAAGGAPEERTMMRVALRSMLAAEEGSSGLFTAPYRVSGADAALADEDSPIVDALTAQLAALDALAVGAQRFAESQYVDASRRAYRALVDDVLTSAAVETRCGTEFVLSCGGMDGACVTPWDLGFALSGLNRSGAILDAADAAEAREWLEAFYDAAVYTAGLLLPSGPVWDSVLSAQAVGDAPRFAPVLVRRACPVWPMDAE